MSSPWRGLEWFWDFSAPGHLLQSLTLPQAWLWKGLCKVNSKTIGTSLILVLLCLVVVVVKCLKFPICYCWEGS